LFPAKRRNYDRNNLIRQLNWSRGRYAMQRIEVTNSDLVHLADKIVLYDRRLEKVELLPTFSTDALQ
jgi:hypothetical protein